MRRAIVFGTGVLTELLYFFVQQEQEVAICGFTVDSRYRSCDSYLDLPLADFETITEQFPPEEYGMYICMGYTDMNAVRQLKFYEAQKKGYEILNYCHPTSVVNAKSVGKGNIILENVSIGPFCAIGDGNIFYPGTIIAHHTRMQDFNYFSIAAAVAGNVTIGNNCFFGNNCTIKNDIDIADKTLVGAGCYVSRDTEPYGVYVPSRSVQLADRKSTEFCL